MPTKEKPDLRTGTGRLNPRDRADVYVRQRRFFSWLLLGLSGAGALFFIILGLLIPPEEQEPMILRQTAPVVSQFTNTADERPDGPAQALADSVSLWDLSLVNADHLWDALESNTLVSVYEQKLDCYNVRDTNVFLEARVMEPLNRMLSDFCADTGCTDLVLCAGYRTEAEQQALWDRSMETYGPEHTEQYLAAPGASEHHTGLAVDFSLYDVATGVTYDFDGSGDSAWMLEHSWEYGFIQRYPEGKAEITGISTEPWHFRFVGQPHAALIHQNGLCLEEYVEWLRQYPYDGAHLTAQVDGTNYELWYCPGDELQYPETGTYTVSGDNCGGAVITREVA